LEVAFCYQRRHDIHGALAFMHRIFK